MSKSEKRVKNAIIPMIRCTQEDKDIITEKANFFGVSVPEYMRRAALGKPLIPAIDQDTLFELRRLGALQKHLFLEGGRVGDREFSEVIVALRECANALKKRISS